MEEEYIFVYSHLDYEIGEILSKGVKKIIFQQGYNKPINNLPECIEKIIIFHNYTEPINNLPSNLKYLALNTNDYQYPLNHLPETLKYLKLGSNPCQLENLPNSLIALQINGYYNYTLENLPNKLEELKIDKLADRISMDSLPNSIKLLLINYKNKINVWPTSLEKLIIYKYNYKLDNIPNILQLHIGSEYSFDIDNVPDSIEILFIGRDYQIPINKLPQSLKILWLENQSLKNIIFKCEISDQIKIVNSCPIEYTDFFN